MNSDLPPYCQPGPSRLIDPSHLVTGQDDGIRYPPYRYGMDAAQPSTSAVQLPYPVPLPSWPNSQGFPPFMTMAVNAAQPPAYLYPPAASLRLPPTEQIPPNCLDWTINPVKAPLRQFKTTSQPLFTLGYSSTISENWMEGDKGLQYSIKNFTFSTKRTLGPNESGCSSQVGDEYDSLLVSIPQVQFTSPLISIQKNYLTVCIFFGVFI